MEIGSDENVVGSSEFLRLEEHVRELERLLRRKMLEVDILEMLWSNHRQKTDVAAALATPVGRERRFPMKRIAETLSVSCSQLYQRAGAKSNPRGFYRKAEDADILLDIQRLVAERPTYGYRRIAALLNRERENSVLEALNPKRIHRIMRINALTLQKHTARRSGRVHNGKVAVMASNLRWCLDALEFACWNGEIVRMDFIIDAFDRI